MRFPIKLNCATWPALLTRAIPSAIDPRSLCDTQVDGSEFSKIISIFKFGTTFKSTNKERFPLTIRELAALKFPTPPIILDVGASDGITSLDLIQALDFSEYFITDLHIEIFYKISGPNTWFFSENGKAILCVNRFFIIYPDFKNAVFPFGQLCQLTFRKAPCFLNNFDKISLINPTLRDHEDNRVKIIKHDLFNRWPHSKPNLIFAANIFNRAYFTDSELRLALNQMLDALKEMGRIAIVENRPNEKASIFKFDNGFINIEKQINGGTEIEDFAMSTFTSILGASLPSRPPTYPL